MSVQVLESLERFEELEGAWRILHEKSATAHLFNGYDWLHAWWRAFAHPQDRLRIYTVRQAGQLTGIWPLYRPAPAPGPRALTEPRLLRTLFNHYSGRSDVLLASEGSADLLELLAAIAEDAALYDVLQIDQVPERSPSFQALAAERLPFQVHAVRSISSPYLELKGSYAEWYEARYSSRRRQQDRRRLRQAEKLGPVELRVLREPAAVRGAFEEGLEIEAKSWKGEAASAIIQDPRTAAFMRDVVDRYARADRLRLVELRIGAQQAAFLLGFLEGGCFYFHKTGYDPAFEEVSPGRQVLLESLRFAFEQGLSRYDFLGAPDPYKLECTPFLEPHSTAFLYHSGLRSQLFRRLKRDLVPTLRRLRGEPQPFEARLDR